jgi:cytochrome c-type biogenesis protein CcmE
MLKSFIASLGNIFSGYQKLRLVFILIIFSSCSSTAYFKTPNDVNKMKGTIYMANGMVKNGLITVDYENYHVDYNQIRIDYADSNQGENLNFVDIISYVVSP